MSGLWDGVRDITLLAVFLRLTFSVISGGVIGAEREMKRRSAGFRTHILICLGAAVAAMTGQFLCIYMGYFTDMTRLGAQVIAGIGFIGAGAIITTTDRQVRGLTTSAGLWAAGIVGLCYGSGFYEGGLAVTILILLAEIFLSKMEWAIRKRTPEITMYIEYSDRTALDAVTAILKGYRASIIDAKYGRADETETSASGMHRNALLQIRLPREVKTETVEDAVKQIRGISDIEIL